MLDKLPKQKDEIPKQKDELPKQKATLPKLKDTLPKQKITIEIPVQVDQEELLKLAKRIFTKLGVGNSGQQNPGSNPGLELYVGDYLGVCLAVPAHAQDIRGYCGPGCATMIYDAFGQLDDVPFSQCHAYTAVYKTPFDKDIVQGDGAFDEWYTSPEQMELMLQPLLYHVKPFDLPKALLKLDEPFDHNDGKIKVDLLLTDIKRSLDERIPVVMLMGYDETTKNPHASGTHWVVVRGYTVKDDVPSGYFTLDPWRQWTSASTDEHHVHHHVDPDPVVPLSPNNPVPEVVASWTPGMARGPGEQTPALEKHVFSNGEDTASNLFRGSKTDGRIAILTVRTELIGHMPVPSLPGDARMAVVPTSWIDNANLWLKVALAGDSNAVPWEFAQALTVWTKPDAFQVHRTDAGGRWYTLLIWNPQNGLRMTAWVRNFDPANPAGTVVEGVSVVRNWPKIHPHNADLRLPNDPLPVNPLAPDPNFPERDALLTRIAGQLAKNKGWKINRLIWEACPLTRSPALPLYEVVLQLDEDKDENLPAKVVTFIVTPDLHYYLTVAGGARAGA